MVVETNSILTMNESSSRSDFIGDTLWLGQFRKLCAASAATAVSATGVVAREIRHEERVRIVVNLNARRCWDELGGEECERFRK